MTDMMLRWPVDHGRQQSISTSPCLINSGTSAMRIAAKAGLEGLAHRSEGWAHRYETETRVGSDIHDHPLACVL